MSAVSVGPIRASDDIVTTKKTYRRRLPTVLLIGASKAGTTTLMNFVGKHPNIVSSDEEVDIFTYVYGKSLKWYKEQMPKSNPKQLTIAKSAGCMFDPNVPERVHTYNSSIKLLMILRHPVERVLSWYAHKTQIHKHLGRKRLSFQHYVFHRGTSDINENALAIRTSRYSDYLPMWLKEFSRNQLLILDGDQFITDPYVPMKEVELFLGVQPFYVERMFQPHPSKQFYCFLNLGKEKSSCMDSSKGREHKALSNETRLKLTEYFKPYTEKLNELAGTNFLWN